MSEKKQFVERLHKKVELCLSDNLRQPVKIIPISFSNWHKVAVGTVIAFEMTPRSGSRVYAGRTKGSDRSILQLFPKSDPLTSSVWVSWHEKWKKSDRESFDLLGISLAFFRGFADRPKEQILRAEWDICTSRESRYAQPHWHVDIGLARGMSFQQRVDPVQTGSESCTAGDESALEELPVTEPPGSYMTSRETDLSAVHLGMGWKHSHQYPVCWNNNMSNYIKDIPGWLENVLLFGIDELKKVKDRPAS